MKQIGLLIRASGAIEVVLPADDKTFTLEELQAHVGGGYIEAVPFTLTPDDDDERTVDIVRAVWCNEDGLNRNLPPNAAASQLYDTWLVGDVIEVRRVAGEIDDEKEDEDE